MLSLNQWLLAAALATTVAAAALRIRALSTSGAIAAILLGTAVVGIGGWWMGVILVVFFATSSLLSRSTHAGEPQARGSRRDWVQVLANGGLVLLGSALWAATGDATWLAFGAGAIAAATADTWSSEIGRTSPTSPRHILTLKSVAPGTSGAVSNRGLLATVAGATFIALIAASTLPTASESRILLFFGVATGGTIGGIVDSLLGASVQEQRWCDSCITSTEANPHRCGAATRHTGGMKGFNNDVVNLVCGVTGALVALLWSIL